MCSLIGSVSFFWAKSPTLQRHCFHSRSSMGCEETTVELPKTWPEQQHLSKKNTQQQQKEEKQALKECVSILYRSLKLFTNATCYYKFYMTSTSSYNMHLNLNGPSTSSYCVNKYVLQSVSRTTRTRTRRRTRTTRTTYKLLDRDARGEKGSPLLPHLLLASQSVSKKLFFLECKSSFIVCHSNSINMPYSKWIVRSVWSCTHFLGENLVASSSFSILSPSSWPI